MHVGRQACPRADGTPMPSMRVSLLREPAGIPTSVLCRSRSVSRLLPFSNSLLTASPLRCLVSHTQRGRIPRTPRSACVPPLAPNSWLVPPPPTIPRTATATLPHPPPGHAWRSPAWLRKTSEARRRQRTRASPRRTRCSTREPIRERVPEVA